MSSPEQGALFYESANVVPIDTDDYVAKIAAVAKTKKVEHTRKFSAAAYDQGHVRADLSALEEVSVSCPLEHTAASGGTQDTIESQGIHAIADIRARYGIPKSA